jgi:hypothetical protein
MFRESNLLLLGKTIRTRRKQLQGVAGQELVLHPAESRKGLTHQIRHYFRAKTTTHQIPARSSQITTFQKKKKQNPGDRAPKPKFKPPARLLPQNAPRPHSDLPPHRAQTKLPRQQKEETETEPNQESNKKNHLERGKVEIPRDAFRLGDDDAPCSPRFGSSSSPLRTLLPQPSPPPTSAGSSTPS